MWREWCGLGFGALGFFFFLPVDCDISGFFSPALTPLLGSLRAKFLCKEYISIAKTATSLLHRTGAWSECYNPEENKITCDELMCLFKHRFENISLCFVCCVKDALFYVWKRRNSC